MISPEIELSSDIDDADEEESLRAFYEEVEAEGMREALRGDPVARLCDYVRFTSYSKGRNRYGERRKRKCAVEVELVGRGNRYVTLNEGGLGGLDRWAEEVLGESVPADEALTEFIRRLRALPELRRIASGKK